MSFTFWSVVGLFLTLFAGGYLLVRRIRRQAKHEGKLEQQKERAEKNAQDQKEMATELLKPRDADKLGKRLSDGDF